MAELTYRTALKLLKGGEAGVKEWNEHRAADPDAPLPDMRSVELPEVKLCGANLQGLNLSGADLGGADLSATNLSDAQLRVANLRGANLGTANMSRADVTRANLREVDLNRALLVEVNLRGADLRAAHLGGTDLTRADVSETKLRSARCVGTNFSDTDLSTVTDSLRFVEHLGPSAISTSTLARFEGKVPVEFLRGCGLQDWEIEVAKLHDATLSADDRSSIAREVVRLQTGQADQLGPIFISFSPEDGGFVEEVGKEFDQLGVRYWQDQKSSNSSLSVLERRVVSNPTLLLVLSETAVKSGWLNHELELANETGLEPDDICPAMLDRYWLDASELPAPVRGQLKKYRVTNFTDWEHAKGFEYGFQKLLPELGIFSRGTG